MGVREKRVREEERIFEGGRAREDSALERPQLIALREKPLNALR